ncbi:hypothetical protein CYY_003400 [Polysphondylium violaceum]|uniref:ACT domain-containing protein n=1 Tax=Polysphondylium violaceum TaxID=133409 RepID=A0A8J4UUB7_9MYCE|nr:hypothetical protein CYY_003400 [Polysphondylium violaceum]
MVNPKKHFRSSDDESDGDSLSGSSLSSSFDSKKFRSNLNDSTASTKSGIASNGASIDASSIKPELILKGYEDINDGVIRFPDSTEIDFVSSVKRVHKYIQQYLKKTPQYQYELLSQLFKCDLELKLENLQLFGDIYVRNAFSVLLGNYFEQSVRLNRKFREVGGFVLVLDPLNADYHIGTIGSILTALHLKMKFIIYIGPGDLTLSQVTRLHMANARGAKIIFHKGDISSCFERALQHAKDMHMVFIDVKTIPQYFLLGSATMAHEMIETSPDRDTVIIPLRMYSVGWSYVCAMAYYYKIVKPKTRIVVVQMTEDLYGKDSDGREYIRQSLFPDRLEIGWLALVHEQSDLTNIFDAFDCRDHGKFTLADVEKNLANMGGDVERNKIIFSKSSLSQTEFVNEVVTQTQHSISVLEHHNQYFMNQFKLDTLLNNKIIDQLVDTTEDQVAVAFIKCLEYTHTLTNGKGAIALGGLMTGQIQLQPNEKVVVLISGGFVDPIDFQTLLQYGLDITGQSFEIELDLPDNTTALSKVLSVIGENKVSIVEVLMDRSCETLKQYHVRTTIQCHSRNFEQQSSVFEIIKKLGFKYNLRNTPLLEKKESEFLSPPFLKASTQSIMKQPTSPMMPLSSTSPSFQHNTTTTTTTTTTSSISSTPSIGKGPYIKRNISDITVESIREAQNRIKDIMHPPPIYHSTTYSKLCGAKVTLMLENVQKTGSFKIRGSSNMVLRALEQSEIKPIGLVAASAGNHAQGVALISAKVGLPCTIVCPEYAPDSKLSSTRQYGAEVIKSGKSLEEAVKCADDICRERNWTLVRPYNDVDVIEGQGTMGCDIYDNVPDVDTVIVNVGGGGMIAGIALFLKKINPNIRIIGVQSANVSPLADFKQTNQFRYIEPAVLSLADGTNVKMPGGVHTRVLHELVDEYVTVSENEIASTIVHLLYNSRTVSEGAGCLGLAALLHHKIKVRKDERVVVIICGGNIDMSTLRQVYEYGLRSLGRSFTVHLTTWDYPGNLSKIISLAARAELKVREIRHIRGGGDINWNEVNISLSFYSNSFHHQNFFLSLLAEEGLFPKIVGRKYIKDHHTTYRVFDKSVEKKSKELKETFSERQKVFLDNYGKQANTSTLM